MNRILGSVLVVLCSVSGWSQVVTDTIETEKGTMLIYSNRTWAYVEDAEFDGVLNHRLQSEIMEDSTLNFVQTWDHDVCYTSQLHNDLSKLKDTLWLCVQDSVNGGFVMPFDGRVTSRYGWRKGRYHNGTDIDLNTGDTVRAAWSGKVRYAKYNKSGFGNLVIIRHANGLETFYAHLSKHLAVPNMDVKAGDPIGLGGNTGHSYGSHLHFEVRFYDAPMDPEHIIDFKNKEVRDDNLMVHSKLFRPGAKAAARTNSNVASSNSGSRKYYRIRSGDTLSKIAVRNRTSVSRICQLNGIRPTTVLQIGRNLRIR
ncbi:MAG: M23 family metallopeptidase [Crocinitomicaceae bacterium]|nr:M23 family metallopeptidase [Crocinitomicaceae bacterium]